MSDDTMHKANVGDMPGDNASCGGGNFLIINNERIRYVALRMKGFGMLPCG